MFSSVYFSFLLIEAGMALGRSCAERCEAAVVVTHPVPEVAQSGYSFSLEHEVVTTASSLRFVTGLRMY